MRCYLKLFLSCAFFLMSSAQFIFCAQGLVPLSSITESRNSESEKWDTKSDVFYEGNYIAFRPFISLETCIGVKLSGKSGLADRVQIVGQRINRFTGKASLRGTVPLAEFPEGGIKVGSVPILYQYRISVHPIDAAGKVHLNVVLPAYQYVDFEVLESPDCSKLAYEPLMFKYQLSPLDYTVIAFYALWLLTLGKKHIYDPIRRKYDIKIAAQYVEDLREASKWYEKELQDGSLSAEDQGHWVAVGEAVQKQYGSIYMRSTEHGIKAAIINALTVERDKLTEKQKTNALNDAEKALLKHVTQEVTDLRSTPDYEGF